MRVTPELHGERFFVRKPDPVTGKLVLWATPLFLALAVINVADLVFAVDSVPAIFAITTDTYIVFTGEHHGDPRPARLYFALAAMVHRFEYLKYALASCSCSSAARSSGTTGTASSTPRSRSR
jgi:tellurite resistance protein TerC